MSKIKWLTKEDVKEYATSPERAMDISVRHHQQNVDATEEELSTQSGPLLEELCGMCAYHRKSNGDCYACPLERDGIRCYDKGQPYAEANRHWLSGDHAAFIKAETALLNKLKSLQSGDKGMDKKKKLEIQIAQNEKDQEQLREVERELKARIAEAEVTYSIGDRFEKGGGKYIMVNTSRGYVNLINLGDGGRWTDEKPVKDRYRITQKEFDAISSSEKGKFCRYWNQAKQEEE